MFTLADILTDLGGNPIPNIALWLYPDTGFFQLIAGAWIEILSDKVGRVTQLDGSWSFDFPWPSVCNPVPLWTLRDGTGTLWSGHSPEGVVGPLDLHAVTHSPYDWTEHA